MNYSIRTNTMTTYIFFDSYQTTYFNEQIKIKIITILVTKKNDFASN